MEADDCGTCEDASVYYVCLLHMRAACFFSVKGCEDAEQMMMMVKLRQRRYFSLTDINRTDVEMLW